MKGTFFVLVFLGSTFLLCGQSAPEIFQYDGKKSIRINGNAIKNLSRTNWAEYKRTYHIKGENKTYTYESAIRKINFDENGNFKLGNYQGEWSTDEENLLFVTIKPESVNKPDEEKMIDAYYIQKLNRRELVLVKALDSKFSNHIVYHYRRSKE